MKEPDVAISMLFRKTLMYSSKALLCLNSMLSKAKLHLFCCRSQIILYNHALHCSYFDNLNSSEHTAWYGSKNRAVSHVSLMCCFGEISIRVICASFSDVNYVVTVLIADGLEITRALSFPVRCLSSACLRFSRSRSTLRLPSHLWCPSSPWCAPSPTSSCLWCSQSSISLSLCYD